MWAQSLERRETEKLVTGILEQIVNDAVDIAQLHTVVRTPTVPVAPPTEPINVFKQMDMPVRDWCMEPIHQAVEAQIHKRPITPDIQSPRSEDSWPGMPKGTPSRPKVGGTPSTTPSRPLYAVPTRATVSPNISRGISLDEGGIPMEQAGLIETYMGGRPHIQKDEAEYTEVAPSGQETSAKESVGDSPRVALRGRKRKRSSERNAEREKMVITTETLEEGEGTGEPVFQAKRKDIVKGKDIGNRASRAKKKKKATETVQERPVKIQEQSSTVFTGGPKEESGSKTTFATSMYKHFKEEQKQLRKDAADPSCSGKGRGKGGAHKRKGKSLQKKKAGPLPLEGWEDPEVVRALAGVAPVGAKREVSAAAGAPSTSDAVVPHTEDSQQSQSSTQAVPQVELQPKHGWL